MMIYLIYESMVDCFKRNFLKVNFEIGDPNEKNSNKSYNYKISKLYVLCRQIELILHKLNDGYDLNQKERKLNDVFHSD